MIESPKTLTVAELRELLENLPRELDDMPVVMEGCDCDGRLVNIEHNPPDAYVPTGWLYLRRD